jgi:predicted DNA-binding protein YlxM (UPF0122 family)
MQPTYATVKEFAEQAGVTTQAIYKRMKTDLQPYVTTINAIKMINNDALKHFEVLKPDVLQKVKQPFNNDIVAKLYDQLAIKDEQIKALNEHIKKQDEWLLNFKQPTETTETNQPEMIEKKSFWERFKK